MIVWIWSAIIALSLILEFATTKLIFVWFAISALISLIMASCGVGIVWQLVVFVVFCLALLFGLRNLFNKYLDKVNTKINENSLNNQEKHEKPNNN